MKYLLDTHIILWAIKNDMRLPEEAKRIIENINNEIYYSSASVWEIAIKHMTHPDKMRISGSELSEICNHSGYIMLPICDRHIYMLETLKRENSAPPHNDPFDRILLSQAKSDKMTFVTHDSLIPYYNEECILKV